MHQVQSPAGVLTHRAADERLAVELDQLAHDAGEALPRRVVARLIAFGVRRWVETGRSGQRCSELLVYGNHGGVGHGGAARPVDRLDECFRRHDDAYDAADRARL